MYKIFGITHGEYSGVREYLFNSLDRIHNVVDIFNSSLPGSYKVIKAYNFAWSYARTCALLKHLPSHPSQWRQLANKNVWIWNMKTRLCETAIRRKAQDIDLVLQVGSFHGVFKNKPTKPYFIYTDGTMEISAKDYPMHQLWPSEKEKEIRKKLEKQAYEKANFIMTFSDCARQSMINDYGIDEHKVATVYAGANIIDLPHFEKDYSKKTILFVGKDFDTKGGQTLVKAFKEIKKELKDVELIIVGEKPKINVEGITMKGHIPWEKRHELLELYRNASVYAMPSIQELFGHVFLEAMAYETPCVGSTSGGIPEIIDDGKTGFVVRPNDHKQLAEKLILMLEDENIMKKMGKAGRKKVEEKFTWDIVADKMTKQFEKIPF